MPQAAIPAIIGAGVGIYGANKQASAAKKAAKASRPMPYSVSGPAGSSTVNGNQITLQQGDNPFSALFQSLGLGSLANAATAPGAFLYGADPELARAYQGLYGQGLTDRIQSQYDLLSQLAAPDEQRARVGLEDQLFARGQSGSTGGAERFRALEEALGQADLQRQAQAVGLGRQEALDRFTGALQGVGSGQAGQMNQYNIGAGAFGGLQQILQNLFQQTGLGISAGGGQAPAAAMYAAQAAGAPYQAANQFLQNSGAYNALGGLFGGGGSIAPNLPSPYISAPDPSSWMPSGNFGL